MKDFVSIGDDGRFRSSRMEQLAQIFEDYDPYLEVQWIPPEYRTNPKDFHYRLVHKHPVIGTYVIGGFYESDDPTKVLAKFLLGDTRKHDVLAEIDALEAAEDLMRMRKWLDEADERKSLVQMFMSDKNYFTMRDYQGDLVKYDANRNKRLLNGRSHY